MKEHEYIDWKYGKKVYIDSDERLFIFETRIEDASTRGFLKAIGVFGAIMGGVELSGMFLGNNTAWEVLTKGLFCILPIILTIIVCHYYAKESRRYFTKMEIDSIKREYKKLNTKD